MAFNLVSIDGELPQLYVERFESKLRRSRNRSRDRAEREKPVYLSERIANHAGNFRDFRFISYSYNGNVSRVCFTERKGPKYWIHRKERRVESDIRSQLDFAAAQQDVYSGWRNQDSYHNINSNQRDVLRRIQSARDRARGRQSRREKARSKGYIIQCDGFLVRIIE